MTPTRVHRLQELVTCLGRMAPKHFFTREDLVRQLQTSVCGADTVACLDAIGRAVSLGVIGYAGAHYLVRRSTTPDDLHHLANSGGVLAEVPQPVPASAHPWLRLEFGLMPRPLHDALTARARGLLGGSGTPAELERQMLLLSARALVQVFQRGGVPA